MSDTTAYMLDEISALKARNRKLRQQLRNMTGSRDRWRLEARAWRWGASHNPWAISPPSPDLSPTERAEAS